MRIPLKLFGGNLIAAFVKSSQPFEFNISKLTHHLGNHSRLPLGHMRKIFKTEFPVGWCRMGAGVPSGGLARRP